MNPQEKKPKLFSKIQTKTKLNLLLTFSQDDQVNPQKLKVSGEISFMRRTFCSLPFHILISEIENFKLICRNQKTKIDRGMIPNQYTSAQTTNPQQTIGPRIQQHRLMTVCSSRDSSNFSRGSLLSQRPLYARKSCSSFPHSLNSVDIGDFSLNHGPALSTDVNISKNMSRSDKKPIRQNGTAQLKQIVKQQKIKRLVRNFIKKATHNNTYLDPVEFTPFFNPTEVKFWDYQGIQINDYIIVLMSVLSTFLIVGLTIIYTLSIVINPFEEGKRIVTLKEIFWYCVRNTLPVDIISIIIIFVNLYVHDQSLNYARLFIIIKLRIVLQKLEKLEIFFIHNFYYEQYWSLLKVFIFNFSLAHFLAIFLIGMASINPNDNWMNYKDIILAPWPEKYAWAYYWATTIMLTVGFGDLAATNYQEAIVLTMIEMISCITLAYNINCVGTLISNIRQQDLEKGKNFKIFYKLSRKNDISEDLQWRINNYIEESSNIKKKFNYQEENSFVENLPNGLRTQFLKEFHKKIFHNLPFFKHLMQRTLFNFAQKIQMHICHPEQIIQHIDQPHNLLILKGGQVGFTCKKNGCDFNNTVVDQIKLLKISEPLLLSLGFIHTPRLIYQIKSLQYSILYYLNFEKILDILKESEMDHELYCLLRDKSPRLNDQFQLFTCDICQGKHTKFTCPKLHYTPFKQQIASKYIFNLKHGNCQREKYFPRYSAKQSNPLKIYKEFNLIDESSEAQMFMETAKESQIINVLSKKKHFEQIEEQPQNQLIKEISDIKDFFSKNTAQLIKQQVNKAFHQGQGRDQVWIINLDKVKNYKTYFQGDNSCNLKNKFFPRKRSGTIIRSSPKLTKIQQKMKNYISSSKGLPYDRVEGQCKDSIRSFKEMISFNSLTHQHKLIFEETDG